MIDSIERILDWVPIGPRFSNTVLQALLVLLKKTPPKDRRLLVLSTTSQKHNLEQMDMSDAFNAEIYVPNVTDLSAVDTIVGGLELFSTAERKKAIEMTKEQGVDKKLSIGIKKLLMLIEMARQDEDKVDKLVSCLSEEGAGINGRK